VAIGEEYKVWEWGGDRDREERTPLILGGPIRIACWLTSQRGKDCKKNKTLVQTKGGTCVFSQQRGAEVLPSVCHKKKSKKETRRDQKSTQWGKRSNQKEKKKEKTS